MNQNYERTLVSPWSYNAISHSSFFLIVLHALSRMLIVELIGIVNPFMYPRIRESSH